MSDRQTAAVERYALVGCGAGKTDEPTEARDLYTSTYFQKKRQVAETCKHWWVLSAEHALLQPSQVVEPYDTTIDDINAESWARDVRLTLRAADGKWMSDDTELLVLAGQDYIEPIREVLDELDNSTTLGVTVRYPFADTSGIGEQLAVLNEYLEQTVDDGQEGLDAFA